MRESTIEKYLRDEVAKAGGTTRKFASITRPNNPDRIVIWPSSINRFGITVMLDAKIHFVECKATGKKARPGQLREAARLNQLGCGVYLFDSFQSIDRYIERHK